MSAPSLPNGYDVPKHVQAGRPDCHVTVGFDKQRGHIPRFLVQLHYQVTTDPVRWSAIARMDHNETSRRGHDVYREGLHVDVERRTGGEVTLHPRHPTLPSNRGEVINGCVVYFLRSADYFIDVYEGRLSPGSPPPWSPDGGEQPHKFISVNTVSTSMSQESPVEDALSLDELNELLADATDTTAEEIERGGSDLADEIAPPWEADVVDE